ncbi:BUD32 family EKC/KEOPS complex subunit [Aliarcobacter butzleri]|uniref:Kae1-associated kinase n=1 Tax=Aliarcobacter butzleri L352 TaxID=1447260 RepID=A0A837JEA8_9BACT|nr:kinase [Aliarcobacter butzleri]KLE07041.1 Kae1-associated kinase [Aliarcobacter butzleri L352]
MNLEEFTKKEVLLNKKEIFSFDFEGKKYWLKKARATRPNKIQNFFYKIFSFELLIPSLEKTPKDALVFETTKIEKFKKLGINVPNIVYKNEDFFVLEDTGKNLNSFLKKNIDESKFCYFVENLLIELAKIHNSKEFHGGAQIRNFTYKDEKVFAIDFEESFEANTTLETLQFRDFLLFLLSFTKLKKLSFEVNYNYIIDKYIELTNNKNVIYKLKNIGKRLKFFIYLSQNFFLKKFLGSDVINFFKLLKILNSLEK